MPKFADSAIHKAGLPASQNGFQRVPVKVMEWPGNIRPVAL